MKWRICVVIHVFIGLHDLLFAAKSGFLFAFLSQGLIMPFNIKLNVKI